MDVRKLVGKLAVRTKPCSMNYGEDNSYRTDSIRILKVTDAHIVYYQGNREKISLLTEEWIDDNWIDYDELISNIEKGDK